MKKLLCVFVLFLTLVSVFTSCIGGGGDEDTKYRVMVSVDGGATVKSENPIEVYEGASAIFDVTVKPDYEFVSTSHGTYDINTGKLTVENVSERINISFVTKEKELSHLKEYSYEFFGEAEDTSTPPNNSNIQIGDQITVKSRHAEKNFLGWSIDKPYSDGGKIVSVNREYTFLAALELINEDTLRVYANYEDKERFTVNLNAPEGAVVSGMSSMAVYSGESVTFDISVSTGY